MNALPAIAPARERDFDAVLALLADCSLPTADVRQHFANFVVAREGETVRGVAGLEMHGACALLRSVAVAEAWRGRGLARHMCDLLVARARGSGVRRVFLLTTTAQDYFGRIGFGPVARDAVPDEIRATEEFRSLCPQTAAVLMRQVGRAD